MNNSLAVYTRPTTNEADINPVPLKPKLTATEPEVGLLTSQQYNTRNEQLFED